MKFCDDSPYSGQKLCLFGLHGDRNNGMLASVLHAYIDSGGAVVNPPDHSTHVLPDVSDGRMVFAIILTQFKFQELLIS